LTLFSIISSVLILGLSKGNYKNGKVLNQTPEARTAQVGSPFESSGSGSRYALVESLAEQRSIYFNESQYNIGKPDVAERDGKIFTIFAPGVSYFALPFYLIGKNFGLQQLFTYSSTAFFAVFNAIIIYAISRKIGISHFVSLLAGASFIFATNALAYALTLTQHHMSTTIILLGVLNAIGKRNWLTNIMLGALFGLGVLVDFPNAIMMMPAVLYALTRHFTNIGKNRNIQLKLKISFIGMLIGLVPVLGIVAQSNKATTGNYFKPAQLQGRARGTFFIEEIALENPAPKIPGKRDLPFNSRYQLRGLYTLIFSLQRGMLVYSPAVVCAILGLYWLTKNDKKQHGAGLLLAATALTNLVLYGSFSDVWGGWSFGARYMIPGLAIASVGLGTFIKYNKKKLLFIALYISLIYGVAVNVLGASTTTQVPPMVEAVNLIEPIPYTYKYNLQLLDAGKTTPLLYGMSFSKLMTPEQFAYTYFAVIATFISALYFMAIEYRKD
jgi:hypothetical protein